MGSQQLLLLISTAFLVLGHAIEDSDSTNPQTHQQAWRESDDQVSIGRRETDSIPSESQDTRSNFQEHPNNGPLVDQERPRPRNRSRSNGKRRRRMRKRPRTTTPEPVFGDEIWEEGQPRKQVDEEESVLHKPRFQSDRIHEDSHEKPAVATDDDIKPPPQRRRPGKRRRPHRRPQRVEYEEYVPDKIHDEPIVERERPEPVQGRKRRKGSGRKRIRVETEPPLPITEEINIQTTITDINQQNISSDNNEEPQRKGFTETRETLETITEPIIYTTIPDKNQNEDNPKTTTIFAKTLSTKINPETSSEIPDKNDDSIQSGSQTPDDQHTEIHYSTTFTTRRTSDSNSETTKQILDLTDSTKLSSDSTESIQETSPPLTTTATTTTIKSIPSRYSTKHKLHSRINTSVNLTKILSTSTELPSSYSVEYNIEKTRKPLTEEQQSEIKMNRKTLFSSSRKLPPTSALIRRRLKEKSNKNNNIIRENNENLTTSPHLNTERKLIQNRNKIDTKNEIEPSTLLPVGFKTNPEILSPMKLLEEITLNEVLKMMTSTTERSDNDKYTTIKIENDEKHDNNSERLNLDGVELPNIRDEILDLIKSESGSSRLARILELRNMTLTELLEHRERGSSQLYFSENFNKRSEHSTSTTTTTTLPPETIVYTTIKPRTVKPLSPRITKVKTVANKPKITTTTMATTTEKLETETKSEEYETRLDIESREKPTLKVEASIMSVPILEPTHTSNIQVPNHAILKSYPKFVIDTLKDETKNINRQKQILDNDKVQLTTSKSKLFTFLTETDEDTEKREPRLFDSMPEFSPNKTSTPQKQNRTLLLNWKSQFNVDNVKPFKGEHKELIIAVTTTGKSKQLDVDDVILFNENEDSPGSTGAGRIIADVEPGKTKQDNHSERRRLPPGVKSAILASGAILGLAILGFLTVLVSCRLRQRNARLRDRRDMLCDQLQEDFRSSQCSLSPVLNKSHRVPVFGQGIHSNTSSNRHYYLWRTLRKTFQYE